VTAATIRVRDVPPEVHEALRHAAALARVSLNDYVLDLLRREVSRAGTRQWLDLLARREPVAGVDVNALLDRARSTQRASLTGRAADGLRR
jgi:plasmid stability protein